MKGVKVVLGCGMGTCICGGNLLAFHKSVSTFHPSVYCHIGFFGPLSHIDQLCNGVTGRLATQHCLQDHSNEYGWIELLISWRGGTSAELSVEPVAALLLRPAYLTNSIGNNISTSTRSHTTN